MKPSSRDRIFQLLTAGAVLTLAARAIAASRRRALARRSPDSAPARTSTVQLRPDGYTLIGRCVTINRPRDTVYAFWRDFQQLAYAMDNLEDVSTDGPVAQLRIRAPFGNTVTIASEIVEDRPGEKIAWKSMPDSQIDTRGQVIFRDGPDNRGTVVDLVIAYKPPLGEAGRLLARAAGREPALQIRRDLRRLRMLLETGEVADSRSYRPKTEGVGA
jgi:uncharacterized membrane protein